MVPIYPLTEDAINPYCGYYVCAVMKDGRQYIGRITGCRNGKLILNGDPSVLTNSHSNTPKKGGKQKGKKGANKESAKLNAFAPYPYGGFGYGAGIALDLALLALLFLVFI